MLARLLMGLFADMVFEVVGAAQRSYEAEIDRYLDGNGRALKEEPEELPAA
jgi:hypothetical protein